MVWVFRVKFMAAVWLSVRLVGSVGNTCFREGKGERGGRAFPDPRGRKSLAFSFNLGKERDCFISAKVPVSFKQTPGCFL